VATCPDIIELETVEKPKRNNHSKLYNGRRSEIVEFCKVNTPAKTLAQYGHLGLKKQTLSDWMNREKIGKPIGVVNTRGRKEVVPKELRLELRATISEIREAGQEVHLQTIVNHMEAIIIQNPGQFNVKSIRTGEAMGDQEWICESEGHEGEADEGVHGRNAKRISDESCADCER
jgi:hypothetical protein